MRRRRFVAPLHSQMSQIGQGIKGQGVPGNMNPRTPWRTTPSNPGPAIDGRPAEEGEGCPDPVEVVKLTPVLGGPRRNERGQ